MPAAGDCDPSGANPKPCGGGLWAAPAGARRIRSGNASGETLRGAALAAAGDSLALAGEPGGFCNTFAGSLQT